MTDAEYYHLIQPYEDAMKLLLTRLEVLNHTMYQNTENKPIHMVQNRIKSKTSIENKLKSRNLDTSMSSAKDMLQDIAGIRVVCYFIADIERLVQMIKNQTDLILIRERDYVSHPKPNGYRSYHMIVGVKVFCLDANEYYPVEIQLRTISMDFWAALEHRISYKKEYDNKEQRIQELRNYSNMLENMEKEFEKYQDT